MDQLPAWANASAVILSCPGPLRRHPASLVPLAELALPQVFLGAESQLLAFAAAAPGLAGRLFFAPFPEMFPDAGSLRSACRRVGGQAAERRVSDQAAERRVSDQAAERRVSDQAAERRLSDQAAERRVSDQATGRRAGGPSSEAQGGRPVHLRFGGARSARVLKGARNGCVLAERESPPPLTASHHPFASGAVLPAAIQRVFGYGPVLPRLHSVLGAPIPTTLLPPNCVTADLAGFTAAFKTALKAGAGPGETGEARRLDLVSLAEFRSLAWAAGPVRGRDTLFTSGDRRRAVLVPWNMDHPGSIVPHLLERLARLFVSPGRQGLPQGRQGLAPSGRQNIAPPGRQGGAMPVPQIVLLPFNYVGQTGIIRRLVTRLRDAAHEPAAFLAAIHLARTGSLEAVATLASAASCAWVDGNDPEHWWTLARLQACGIAPVLIDPGQSATPGIARVAADEAIWVEAETRCGTLTFPARVPSLRALPDLLSRSSRKRQDGRAGRLAGAAPAAKPIAAPPPPALLP